ncbi:hypothetical protein [Paenibacillus massiliensis]|uniref:hypothetical protein n=1 Tax=Paenibacillus massiliensis TaxID=225917 RepID=UPI0012EC60C3|nr:hypothetical protein [Paenibacillus massiliensis]
MKEAQVLKAAYNECVKRCKPEEVQDFINRARNYWSGNNEMTTLIQNLESGVNA